MFTSIMIPFGVGVLLEILQGLGIISGTMDIVDMLVELMGCRMSYFILKEKNYE